MSRTDRRGLSRGRRRFLQAAALAAVAGIARGRAASRAHVVIVGGGFAGAGCALALRRLAPQLDVTLIDADADYVTGPMSNAVLAGWRSLPSITVSRAGLERAGVDCVRERVVAIDADRRRVRLAGGGVRPYDRLVVAPGIRLLRDSPAGYTEAAAQQLPHAWLPGQQTQLLAAQLRALADGGVVAISVPVGLMRCPPGPYERATVIAAWLKQHKPRSKVLIFDANNHFPRQDVFTAVWNDAYPGLVDWIASTDGGTVERVDARTKTLYTARGAQRVAVGNVIPRQAPGQLALDAGLCSGNGWCPVDPATFESTLVSRVHVIGDACIAGAMPKSASAAHSQALQCARAVAASLSGSPTTATEFDSVCYSLLGQDRALAIHGRFAVEHGEIRSLPLPSPTVAPSPQAEARLADAWYRRIVADTFAT